MKCTIEKLSSLQQLYITLQHTEKMILPFTPLLAVTNEYPYKPILHIRANRASSSASSNEDELLLSIPLNVRVDLSDHRNQVTQNATNTIISLRIKQGQIDEDNELQHNMNILIQSSLHSRTCSHSLDVNSSDLAEAEGQDDFPTPRELSQ